MKAMDLFLHSPQMMDLNKRQAQYLALQNQINPTFFYIIHWRVFVVRL